MIFRCYHLGICVFMLLLSLIYGKPSNPVAKEYLNYCANDAVCVMVDKSPQCYCLPEWQGERCNIIRKYIPTKKENFFQNSRVDLRNTPCSFVPDLCENGGLCKYSNKKYECICPETHFGPRCASLSPCNGFCYNDGICELLMPSNEPECQCNEKLFTGIRCHIPVTTPIPPTTLPPPTTIPPTDVPDELCEAYQPMCGPGKCARENNQLTCKCPSTHTGKFCENRIGAVTSSSSSPRTSVTVQPPGTSVTVQPPGTSVTVQPPGTSVTVQPPGTSVTVQPPGTTVSGQSPPTTIPGQSTVPPVSPPDGITCAQRPCQNNRPCYNNGNSYFCFCGPQYQGINCQINIG